MSFVKRGNLPELLAPAGSLEHLKAAVSAAVSYTHLDVYKRQVLLSEFEI